MKKRLFLLSICLMLALLFAGCGKQTVEDSSQEIHPHTFSEQGANATHHWIACECGEKDRLAKHDFTDVSFCKTCGFYIYDIGDDCYSFYIPDEYGSIVHQVDFDADGNTIYDWRADIQYYEDQNPKFIQEYLDGILQSQQTYLYCENPENGDVYLSEEVYFYEDGAREVLTYDEYFKLTSITLLDSAGNIATQDIYSYDYDNAGNCIRQTVHTNGVLSLEIFYESNAEGYFYESHYVYYNENGQIESEFRFDEFGNELS